MPFPRVPAASRENSRSVENSRSRAPAPCKQARFPARAAAPRAGRLLSVWLPHHTLSVTPFALFSLPSFIRSLVTGSPVGARRPAKCRDLDTRTEADKVLALARLAVWRRKSQTWPPGLCTNKHLGACNEGGGGATAPGGFLKETTLMLRSGRQIREECSFQTEADRMRGELCGVNSRDRVEASEGARRAGMRADGLEGRSGAGPSGPGSLSRGGMALRIGRRRRDQACISRRALGCCVEHGLKEGQSRCG